MRHPNKRKSCGFNQEISRATRRYSVKNSGSLNLDRPQFSLPLQIPYLLTRQVSAIQSKLPSGNGNYVSKQDRSTIPDHGEGASGAM
jgi:hypothetical protein